eukprot:EG_transcript_22262
MADQARPLYVERYAPYTVGFDTQYVDTDRDAQRLWDYFYKANTTRFFKDRHWMSREFRAMFEAPQRPLHIMEAGCGVGNTVYPLLEELPHCVVFCFDFSRTAVQLVKEHPKYDPERVVAMVHDLTAPPIPPLIPADMHFATLIFVMSAIPDAKHQPALHSVFEKLRSGGVVYFRDYAVDDMTQRRFRESAKVDENTFRRHDGTRTFFFSTEYWAALGRACGFVVLSCEYVRKTVTNAKEGKEMHRTFLQSELRKP